MQSNQIYDLPWLSARPLTPRSPAPLHRVNANTASAPHLSAAEAAGALRTGGAAPLGVRVPQGEDQKAVPDQAGRGEQSSRRPQPLTLSPLYGRRSDAHVCCAPLAPLRAVSRADVLPWQRTVVVNRQPAI